MKKLFNFSAYVQNHGRYVTKKIEVSDDWKNDFVEGIMCLIVENGRNKEVTVKDLPNWCKYEVLKSWGVNDPRSFDEYPAVMSVCCDLNKFEIVFYVELLSEN